MLLGLDLEASRDRLEVKTLPHRSDKNFRLTSRPGRPQLENLAEVTRNNSVPSALNYLIDRWGLRRTRGHLRAGRWEN